MDRAIADVLSLEERKPSPQVNAALSTLVADVTTAKAEFDTAGLDPCIVADIRRICAEAETEMELYWAQRIASSADPRAEAHRFPYKDNYACLAEREIEKIEESGLKLTTNMNMLIIGSGPLPLTAVEFHNQAHIAVDQIDRSKTAVDYGRKVSKLLNIPGDYIHADGDKAELDKTYNVVLIAALAGLNEAEKQLIVDSVLPNLASAGRIVVRSAHGARALLYPIIDSNKLSGLNLLVEHHPTDAIINSILVFERKS